MFLGQTAETPYNADDKEVENILNKKDSATDQQPGTALYMSLGFVFNQNRSLALICSFQGILLIFVTV